MLNAYFGRAPISPTLHLPVALIPVPVLPTRTAGFCLVTVEDLLRYARSRQEPPAAEVQTVTALNPAGTRFARLIGSPIDSIGSRAQHFPSGSWRSHFDAKGSRAPDVTSRFDADVVPLPSFLRHHAHSQL